MFIVKLFQKISFNYLTFPQTFRIYSQNSIHKKLHSNRSLFSHISVNAKSQTVTTPIQDLQEIFVSYEGVQLQITDYSLIQDSNHERKRASEHTVGGVDGDGKTGGGGPGVSTRRRPGGESCVTERAATCRERGSCAVQLLHSRARR